MSAGETEICNNALILVGAQRILSLDDNSDRAKLLKEKYPLERDSLLASHPWNFSVDRAELAPSPTPPTFKWSHKFKLPPDCLRVLNTDLYEAQPWKVEGDYLVCDSNVVRIEYIKRVTDTSKMTALFKELLSQKIAASTSYAITQSASLQQNLYGMYRTTLREARSYDAQESMGDKTYTNQWLNARF